MLMKSATTTSRMEAMSGWVRSRVRKGARWVCRVRVRPRVVVRRVRMGLASDAGRRRGSRVA